MNNFKLGDEVRVIDPDSLPWFEEVGHVVELEYRNGKLFACTIDADGTTFKMEPWRLAPVPSEAAA